MNAWLSFALGAALALGAAWLPRCLQPAQAAAPIAPHGAGPAGQACLHTHTQFAFVASAPLQTAWPLFGAQQERDWAPGWDPEFVWPPQAVDQEGMVFRIRHGAKTAVWVNTSMDLAARRIQYVYVLADTLVTVITLHLSARQEGTHVAVTYDRTALDPSANDQVRDMATRDAAAGPDWRRQIDDHLANRARLAGSISGG
jgi:hypothetical protein